MNKIEQGWVSFRAEVMHEDTPDDQVFCMRMAFYGGALETLNVIVDDDAAVIPEELIGVAKAVADYTKEIT